MDFINSKFKIYAKFSAFMFVVLSIITYSVIYFDERKDDLYHFVTNNEKVISVTGEVKKVSVHERVSQGLGNGLSRYKYSLRVKGNKSTKDFIVKAEYINDKWEFVLADDLRI